jgi:hypothetical protein
MLLVFLRGRLSIWRRVIFNTFIKNLIEQVNLPFDFERWSEQAIFDTERIQGDVEPLYPLKSNDGAQKS